MIDLGSLWIMIQSILEWSRTDWIMIHRTALF